MKIDRKWLNIILPLAFVLMCVAFILLHLFDGSVMWSGAGFGSLHRVICKVILPAPETFSDNQTYRTAWSHLWALWGIGFAFFPLLSLVLTANGKKVPAIVFAGINMALSLIFTVHAFLRYRPHASISSILITTLGWIGWVLFIVAGVLILLNALGRLKNKKLTVIFFVSLSCISIVLFGLLASARGKRVGNVDCVINVLRQYRHLNQSGVLNTFAALHPFSCAVLFATMGLASICTFPKCKKRRIATVDRAVQTETVEKASELSLMDELEKLAQLHEQGDLTDEEFQQEKERILARM